MRRRATEQGHGCCDGENSRPYRGVSIERSARPSPPGGKPCARDGWSLPDAPCLQGQSAGSVHLPEENTEDYVMQAAVVPAIWQELAS